MQVTRGYHGLIGGLTVTSYRQIADQLRSVEHVTGVQRVDRSVTVAVEHTEGDVDLTFNTAVHGGNNLDIELFTQGTQFAIAVQVVSDNRISTYNNGRFEAEVTGQNQSSSLVLGATVHFVSVETNLLYERRTNIFQTFVGNTAVYSSFQIDFFMEEK